MSPFPPPGPASLALVRNALLGLVVTAFPAASYAVFGLGMDRTAVADALSYTFGIGLVLLFSAPFWPLPGLDRFTPHQRLGSAVLLFLGFSYATHLSWELGWLVMFERIRDARDALWAYPWWAYIDGGDARYLHGSIEVRAMECLSVTNGLVGVVALRRTLLSEGRDRAAVLLLGATAAVHLYSALLYYLTEGLAGFPNVDTTRFVNLWIKFGLANLPWVVMPFAVFRWVHAVLSAPPAAEAHSVLPAPPP